MHKYNWIFLNIILFVLFLLILFPSPGICAEENIIVKWGKTFGGSDKQYSKKYARSLIQNIDGGYAVAGDSRFGVYSDFWVIKLDSRGNKDWNETFSGSGRSRK